MGLEEEQLAAIARQVVATLTARGETLATCESLTAGMAAASIAGIPGSSAVLRGGLVTYATDLKESLAGVDKRLLRQRGPVSAETAAQMADGARRACGADWAVSFTGVAGPGSQDGHPVGEVYVAVAGGDGTRATQALIDDHLRHADNHGGMDVLDGDRAQIRSWAVVAGFKALLERLS